MLQRGSTLRVCAKSASCAFTFCVSPTRKKESTRVSSAISSSGSSSTPRLVVGLATVTTVEATADDAKMSDT